MADRQTPLGPELTTLFPYAGSVNYRALLDRLEKSRGQGVTLGLSRVEEALALLGNPEARIPAVHIAGTNGKGSCAAMTESILRLGGFRTGLFTSPHLVRFTERIRIQGDEIDGDELANFDSRLVATGVPLTFFEISLVLAMVAFAEKGVEIAVLETGLGGRLDATSACRPLACGITSIALDHEAILGSTVEAIAYEKACIAKPGVPLFTGPLAASVQSVIRKVCDDRGAPFKAWGQDLGPAPFPTALPGQHQLNNAGVACALATTAAQGLGRPLNPQAVEAGLGQVTWPGRCERMPGNLLLDCAHNPEGAEALARNLPDASFRILVTSIVRDKDAAKMLAIWAPHFDEIVCTTSDSERCRDPEQLAMLISSTRGGKREVTCLWDAPQALAYAREKATSQGGWVVVAGSIFLVGALRDTSIGGKREPSDPMR